MPSKISRSSSKRSDDVQVVGDLVGLDPDQRRLDRVRGPVERLGVEARERLAEARRRASAAGGHERAGRGRPSSPTAGSATRRSRARPSGTAACARAPGRGRSRTARGRPRASPPTARCRRSSGSKRVVIRRSEIAIPIANGCTVASSRQASGSSGIAAATSARARLRARRGSRRGAATRRARRRWRRSPRAAARCPSRRRSSTGAQLGGLHPRLEVVEQRVVGVLELEALDVAALELDHALEVGQEGGEVGALAGRLPGVLGDRGRARDLGSQLGRHPARLLPVAPGDPDQAGLERVVRRPSRLGRGASSSRPSSSEASLLVASAVSVAICSARIGRAARAASSCARPTRAAPGRGRGRRSRRAARAAPRSRPASTTQASAAACARKGVWRRRIGKAVMAVMTPRDPFGRAVLRTVLIVVVGRSRPLPDLPAADAADLARDRGLHRGRDVGAGEPAPAAHEARAWRSRSPTLALVMIPIGLGALLIPSLVGQIENLGDNVPEYAQDVTDFVNENQTLNDLNDKYDFTGELQSAADDLPSKIGDAAGVLQDIGVGVVNSIFAAVTILILSIFMVAGGPRWAEAFVRAQPPDAGRARRAGAARRRQRDRQLRRRGAGAGDDRRGHRLHRPDDPRRPVRRAAGADRGLLRPDPGRRRDDRRGPDRRRDAVRQLPGRR